MNQDNNRLTIREFPTALWILGIFVMGLTFFIYRSNDSFLALSIGGITGLLFILFSSILTVIADKSSGILTVSHRSLLRNKSQEIPFNQVDNVILEQSASIDSDSGRRSRTYRLAIQLKDGTSIPFRSYYSSGLSSKEKNAQQLRSFLGVGGDNHPLSEARQTARSALEMGHGQDQASITGDPSEEHVTHGVTWKLETSAFAGSPVTRWYSKDYYWDDDFLYLAQKMEAQKELPGSGAMGFVNKMLFKQSMKFYRFEEYETPNFDNAHPIENLDPRLVPHFTAITSNPDKALQTLNPWMTMPLASWAEKYPLRHGTANQLVILIGPAGVYLAILGLINPELVDELASLGVELVRAQGGGES